MFVETVWDADSRQAVIFFVETLAGNSLAICRDVDDGFAEISKWGAGPVDRLTKASDCLDGSFKGVHNLSSGVAIIRYANS